MSCCLVVEVYFEPSPEQGNRGSCHQIQYSTGWEHQIPTCGEIVYWTCELMVEKYQFSDCTQYCMSFFESGQKEKISKTTFKEFIDQAYSFKHATMFNG